MKKGGRKRYLQGTEPGIHVVTGIYTDAHRE